MNKSIFYFLILGTTLMSCSNNSDEYDVAAKELCSCMSEKNVDAEDAFATNISLGLCLIDSKVDLKNPKMADAVGEVCPEFKSEFEDLVEELK